ncbi:MAG: thiamine phosphate synthase [Bacteroidia bacterium]
MEIARLHYLTQDKKGCTHAELAEKACKSGVRWVQLRTKNKTTEEWKRIALEVKEVTDKYDATLIINDNVSLAKEINANGVHLGKKDMHPQEARALVGKDFIIGCTANSATDVEELLTYEIDYIGLGPFRYTVTKDNLSPVISSLQLQYLLSMPISKPIIVIGGIQIDDVENILDLGAHGVAVSSAINLAHNIEESAAAFVKEIEKLKN